MIPYVRGLEQIVSTTEHTSASVGRNQGVLGQMDINGSPNTDLRWHHFGIRARDLHAGEQTCSVVGLYHTTTQNLICTDGAVVWP